LPLELEVDKIALKTTISHNEEEHNRQQNHLQLRKLTLTFPEIINVIKSNSHTKNQHIYFSNTRYKRQIPVRSHFLNIQQRLRKIGQLKEQPRNRNYQKHHPNPQAF
jgi:hypothetical protein